MSSYLGVAALSASDGMVAQATDEEILVAQRDLSGEGVFADPASATALAGLHNVARSGALPPGLRIVLVNTSNGLEESRSSAPVLSRAGVSYTIAAPDRREHRCADRSRLRASVAFGPPFRTIQQATCGVTAIVETSR